MPSVLKSVLFLSSAMASTGSVAFLGLGMSEDWATTTMACGNGGTGLFNGSAEITIGLFNGMSVRNFCPLFGASNAFEVTPQLVETGYTTSIVLHALVLVLVALCLLFTTCSLLICLYNSVSNPYETYMGPVGVYACSSISACLSVLVMILFAVNVTSTAMAEEVVKEFSAPLAVDLKDKTTTIEMGFFMVIPYMVLSLLSIFLIFLYQHMAYTHRREQEKPTEDAPKDIMMY